MESEDFWARVAQSGVSDCWLWLGACDPRGSRGRLPGGESAQRRAWGLVCGPVPSGLNVVRLCDGDGCVRPDHMVLWAEWDLGGMARMRGTTPRGPSHGRSKMTEAGVLEARRRWSAGETCYSLARAFGVGYTPMDYLLTGKTWRHLPLAKNPKHGPGRRRQT